MTEPWRESNHPALYYQSMLADERRMRRYQAAIEAVVRPGDVVVDLGTGLGVLAMMAARAGAAKVYAVEVRPQVVSVARAVIEANGLADRVIVIQSDAMDVDLPEPVDVIVNELIGDFGTDENIQECVRAVADRSLKPGGRVLPSRLTTWLVGVTYEHELRGVYGRDFHGMDLRAALADPFAPEAIMHGLLRRPKELTTSARVEDWTFGRDMPARDYEPPVSLEVTEAGELQGFAGYFKCELAPGIELDNYPCYPGCHWVNWHWPVTPPLAVAPGDRLDGVLTMPRMTLASCWRLDWRHEQA
jgi:SAM-dependent methyltransferase